MAISGLVITTRTTPEIEDLASTLAQDPRFTCGPIKANRLAAVLDTTDDGDEDICRWLWTQRGVVLVDVVAIHLSADCATPDLTTGDQRDLP